MAKPVKIRWADLTSSQQAEFGNGCGPDWLPRWMARLLFGWFFEASCRRHDFAYTRGGDDKDRLAADRGFFKAMLRDVKRLHWSLQLPAYAEALAFYGIARLLGRWQFHYGPYRSLTDLHLAKLNNQL